MSRSPQSTGLARRALLRGSLGAGGLLLLAACGDSPGNASPTGTAWEFTDDRGKKVTRPQYPADVILYDERTRDIFTKSRIPTYLQMPAVKAGQTIAWNPTLPTSWAGFSPALRKLTADLSRLRPLG